MISTHNNSPFGEKKKKKKKKKEKLFFFCFSICLIKGELRVGITLHRTSCYPYHPAVRITQRHKTLIINANRREEEKERERERERDSRHVLLYKQQKGRRKERERRAREGERGRERMYA